MMRSTRIKTDSANGIAPGDRVRWKTGYRYHYGEVLEIYLSFKYPRGLKFWTQPTITVATVFIIRGECGTDYHLPQDEVKKVDSK
jgi:hypothetical protein